LDAWQTHLAGCAAGFFARRFSVEFQRFLIAFSVLQAGSSIPLCAYTLQLTGGFAGCNEKNNLTAALAKFRKPV